MHDSRITRSDVVVLAAALILLGSLLFPALAASNSNADVLQCTKNLGQLVVGLLKCHDNRKGFPMTSTQPINHKPGSDDPQTAAGYSWLVSILPYLEQHSHPGLDISKSFSTATAFDPDLSVTDNGQQVPPATLVINEFICPSSARNNRVVAEGSDYKALKNGQLPALTNYNGFAGTHFYNSAGLGRLVPEPTPNPANASRFEGNGALPFPGITNGELQKTGLTLVSIADGMSKTFCIAETIEPAYSAWFDGQATWLVAAWPDNPKLPEMRPSKAYPNVAHLKWSDDETLTSRVAVNLRKPDGAPITYLRNGRWSGSKERRFAASSNHPNGVAHAYMDGHVVTLSSDVDQNVYIQLVTRNGREPISDELQAAQAKKMPDGNPTEDQLRRLIKPGPIGMFVQEKLWFRQIDWSPVVVGDYQLSFPETLNLRGFVVKPEIPGKLVCGFPSQVFSSFTYDPEKTEFELLVNEKESPSATSKLYKQLCASLGDPTKKEIETNSKRVTWERSAKWADGAGQFKFVLSAPAGKQPGNIVIQVIRDK